MANLRDAGWAYFDAIVAVAPSRDANPWQGSPEHPTYVPDYETLALLLGVPVHLRAPSQSGVPALALDVWVAYEFRRAGFDPDRVWPRATPPRVLPSEITQFVERLPRADRAALWARIGRGHGGSGTANLLGKNYVKQVDVVMSSWATGPELMVSTKRMDSSFGKNVANRVEESYGDAKNLRLRHPQAALGFVYALSAVALRTDADIADWLIDLLIKLGREDDAYDAVALILPDLDPSRPEADEPADEVPEEPAGPIEAGASDEWDSPAQPSRSYGWAYDVPALLPMSIPDDPQSASDSQPALFAPPSPGAGIDLSVLPRVGLRQDQVPAELDPGRFFTIMCARLLDNSPINFHAQARNRRKNPTPAD